MTNMNTVGATEFYESYIRHDAPDHEITIEQNESGLRITAEILTIIDQQANMVPNSSLVIETGQGGTKVIYQFQDQPLSELYVGNLGTVLILNDGQTKIRVTSSYFETNADLKLVLANLYRVLHYIEEFIHPSETGPATKHFVMNDLNPIQYSEQMNILYQKLYEILFTAGITDGFGQISEKDRLATLSFGEILRTKMHDWLEASLPDFKVKIKMFAILFEIVNIDNIHILEKRYDAEIITTLTSLVDSITDENDKIFFHKLLNVYLMLADIIANKTSLYTLTDVKALKQLNFEISRIYSYLSNINFYLGSGIIPLELREQITEIDEGLDAITNSYDIISSYYKSNTSDDPT